MDPLLEALQKRLGYCFSDKALLSRALTHKSYSNENPNGALTCNERLEFLGDAVLDLVISQETFEKYTDLPEGELTRIRAELVSEKNLSMLAKRLEIGPCLLLGRGERRSGGEQKSSLLADSVEALFGAILCDSDYLTVRSVVSVLFTEAIVCAARKEYDVDHKTILQEICQSRYRKPPVYQLLSATGPDHQKQYEIEVLLDGESVGRGTGRSKKAAEQQAAESALEQLNR
ncbi:MAG: ribonuclease III [Desulfuromonadales bacterium]|nr:ribonuclease III [Desulfuromonadales bacterium]